MFDSLVLGNIGGHIHYTILL